MKKPVTATMLYNLVQCPHRLHLDLYGDPSRRDPESRFVQLLWERGTLFEKEVVEELEIPFTDLGGKPGEERERLTAEALKRGADLIYGGRIRAENLLGDPDLLRREGKGYVPGDIKSGSGEEGADGETQGKPKKHYAVQLALYGDILELLGMSAGGHPFVWDIHRREVAYDLRSPLGPRTRQSLWEFYRECLGRAKEIVARKAETRPALCSACKTCHWRSFCLSLLIKLDDLTLIPELGRKKRDAMLGRFRSVSDLANADLGDLVEGKDPIPGIGPDTLKKLHSRAVLQKKSGARPYVKKPFTLPDSELQLFFDIETDPMRDLCYLHGFLERRGGVAGAERYRSFLAVEPTPEEEKNAFAAAWSYVRSSQPCVIYYYSKYERTWWYKLQERYPDVAGRADLEAMFEPSRAIDLYFDVVRPCTEWPTRDYSIKTLAVYLDFNWRDPNPSGAESVEWFCRMVASPDPDEKRLLLARLLAYNEDDCRAMRVLLEGLRGLEMGPNGPHAGE